MINLDDANGYAEIDTQDMLGHIEGLPAQLEAAWNLGLSHPLPDWMQINQVVIAGMGGSAIGADLLAAYAAESCPVPVSVHRDYGLPSWAHGRQTLVIASSHSGNTEETLSSLEEAVRRDCRILAITTGGRLAQAAEQAQAPVWLFEDDFQPRAAVGFSFGLLLAAFTRLRLLPNPAEELAGALAAMRAQQEKLAPAVPVTQNLAKRQAGQIYGRAVVVFGAGLMAPVARRWKGQISELAKAWAQFEFLPEADHNTLAGLLFPEEALAKLMALFITAPSDHPRNRLRSDLTRRTFMLEGISTDPIAAAGDTPLANLWTALHLGDYVSYYLALMYGVDPTPVAVLENFKRELKASS